MKNFGIPKPCDANWSSMTPTEKGAFCQLCAKQVIDFTSKSTDYIKAILLQNRGESVCGRITLQQEVILENDFALWQQSNSQQMRRISLYAFILVFGLSIVSCADEQDKEAIHQIHQTSLKMLDNTAQEIDVKTVKAEEVNTELGKVQLPTIEFIEVFEDGNEENQQVENVLTLSEEDIPKRMIYTTMGAMRMPDINHIRYLEETVVIRYDENAIPIPTAFSSLAFPNPTKDNSTLKFEVPTKIKASISIYDINGTLVREIESRKFEAGTHNLSIDLSENKPGTYLLYIMSKEYKESLRVVKVN